MIFIGKYNEISPNKGYPSMRDYMSSERYDGQDVIVRYLKRGKVEAVASGGSKPDVFTGEQIKGEWSIQSDGEYAWGSELSHYVDKYNLILPEDFVKHVLS